MSKAVSGQDGFDGLMVIVGALPALGFIEVLFILAPLAFHTAFVTVGGYSSSTNVFSYPNYRNWIYLAKRIAGIGVVAFVPYHLFVKRFSYIFAKDGMSYPSLASGFSSARVEVIYFAGLACMSFYLGVSISAFFFEWGVATSKRSRKMFDMLAWVVASVFAIWGISVVRAFS
jgi:succinate dehydrogenase/fumarate reductase cytochrome b subunit